MISRRHFLASGAAAAATATAVPAWAQGTYTIPPEHMPVYVRTPYGVNPWEIHVDPDRFVLYWTLPDQRAIRYVVGVGRAGLYEPGEYHVGAKKEWPSWTPTKDMIARNPGLYGQWADGMPGGPTNPLGARALYLFTPQRGDTFLRIHGTPEPWTIGQRVSNGCTRLANSHIVHLYDQVPVGVRVVLHPMGIPPVLMS